MKMPSESTRAYLYNICLTTVPLLVTYGVVSAANAPLFLALALALLGLGLARANTTRKP